MRRTSSRGAGLTGLAGFLVVVAAGVRILLLFETGTEARVCDARGFVLDLGVAVLAAAAALALGNVRRWLVLPPALLWLLLVHVGYEHVRALGAPIQWRELGMLFDPAFLGGSALRPSHPWLVLALVVGLVAVSLRAAGGRPGRQGLLLTGGAGAALLAVGVLLPNDPDCLAWRQAALAVGSPGGSQGASTEAVTPADPDAPPPDFLAADLSGTPIGPRDRPPRNVLLVMLEGVSGLYLPSVAQVHGWEAKPALPRIDAAMREGRWAPTFLAQQRQTQRGMYPILCGDLPKLLPAEPRFAELARGEVLHPCLPRVLENRGFATHYLQAAPLAFMQKDRALPVIGFREIRGAPDIEGPAFRTQWGVDDDAFFREAIRALETLRASDRPWMLTLLTVGTHHPFVIPPDVVLEGVPERHRPFVYLDEAFATFWRTARREGLLRDTLVVLTSDESLGVEEGGDLQRALSQNLGFAAVLGPGIPAGEATEPFAQSDLAITILDALGIAPSPGILGRSLLRTYDTARPLPFGNVYLDRAWGLWPGGLLLECGPSGARCRAWRSPSGDPFARAEAPQPAAVDPAEIARLRNALAYSLREPRSDTPSEQALPLHPPGELAIPDTTTYQLLFGEQHMDLPPGSLEVELAVRVTGEAGLVHVRHDVVDEQGPRFVSHLPVLAPGDRFRLLYRVDSAEPWRNLSIRASADRLAGTGLGLVIEVAEARFEPPLPGEEPPGPPGVRILDETVERAESGHFATRDLASWTDLPECLRREGDRLVGECPESILAGAAFPAPHGSRVELVIRVRGHGSASALLGSPEAGILLAESPAIRLSPAESRLLVLETRVRAVLNGVRPAIRWVPDGEAGEVGGIEILGMEVFVEYP